MLNEFIEDYTHRMQLIQQEYPPKGLFTISHDNPESDPHLQNIYVVLWIEKTLGTNSPAELLKLYTPGASQLKAADLEKQYGGLKTFVQPFLFGFMPLYKAEAANASAPDSKERSRSVFRKPSRIAAQAPALGNNTKSKLRTGFIPFSYLYPSAILSEDKTDIFTIIQENVGNVEMGSIAKIKCKLKNVPAHAVIEIVPFVPSVLEKDPVERALMFFSDKAVNCGGR